MSIVTPMFPREWLDENGALKDPPEHNQAHLDCPKPKRYVLFRCEPQWLANPLHSDGGTTALKLTVLREANQRPAVLMHRAAYLQSNTVNPRAWYEVRERTSKPDYNGEQVAGWRTTEKRIWP